MTMEVLDVWIEDFREVFVAVLGPGTHQDF
jgi:hypothetical protein